MMLKLTIASLLVLQVRAATATTGAAVKFSVESKTCDSLMITPVTTLPVVPTVDQAGLMTQFMTVSTALQAIDVNDAAALESGTTFFRDYGRQHLAQLGADNIFLDAMLSERESPHAPLAKVTGDVVQLSKMVQGSLDPATAARLAEAIAKGDFADLAKGFRQIMLRRFPGLAADNITVRQAFKDIAITIKAGIDQLEDGRLEIQRIQAHLRQVRDALEHLSTFGKMADTVFAQQISGVGDQRRRDVLLRTHNRFGKTLTQIAEGATLAAQLDKVWSLMAENYLDAIDAGEDAILIALPAHRAVEAARIAQSRARRVQAASAAVQKAKSMAFAALAKELGEGETERQTFRINWLEESVTSFTEMGVALVDVETRRATFERGFGDKMRTARENMNQIRGRLDAASVGLLAAP